MRRPQSPSAAWNACAVGFAVCEVRSSVTPAAVDAEDGEEEEEAHQTGHRDAHERAAGDLAEVVRAR